MNNFNFVSYLIGSLGVATAIIGCIVGYLGYKSSKKHDDTDTKLSEISLLREEVDSLKRQVKELSTKISIQDLAVFEAERMKVVAMNRVTALEKELEETQNENIRLRHGLMHDILGDQPIKRSDGPS